MVFASLSDIFIVGDGGLALVCTGGGGTFFVQNTGVTGDLNALSFPTAEDGWAVGAGGAILKFGPPPVEPNIWNPPVPVTADATASNPDITMTLGGNTAHIVWNQQFFVPRFSNRIFYSTESGDKTWTPGEIISGTGERGQDPSITHDTANRLYVVWTEGKKIALNEKAPGGGWGTPAIIAESGDDTFGRPVVVADSTGGLHVAWVRGRLSGFPSQRNNAILYSFWAANTGGWTSQVAVDTGFFGDFGIDLQMVVGSGDALHVVYTARTPTVADRKMCSTPSSSTARRGAPPRTSPTTLPGLMSRP